jgi:hypothetical protein
VNATSPARAGRDRLSRAPLGRVFALASLAAGAAAAIAVFLLVTKTVTGEETNPPFFVLLAAAPLALAAGLLALATDSSSWLARASVAVSGVLLVVLAMMIEGIE